MKHTFKLLIALTILAVSNQINAQIKNVPSVGTAIESDYVAIHIQDKPTILEHHIPNFSRFTLDKRWLIEDRTAEGAARRGLDFEFGNLLISVLKDAAMWGLEEAGTRILGYTGWKLCKSAFRPVLEKLRISFPELFNNDFLDTQQARMAANQAIELVNTDPSVKRQISEGINQLTENQRDMMVIMLQVHENTIKSLQNQEFLLRKIDALTDMVDSRLSNLESVSVTNKEPTPEGPVTDWFQRAIEIDDLDSKIQYYTNAIRNNQNTINSFFYRGLAYLNLKQFKKAYDDNDVAISLSPNFAEAFTNRAVSSYWLGQYNQAIADFETSIQLNPRSLHNYRGLATIYSSQKNYKEAYLYKKLELQNANEKQRSATLYGSLSWYALFNREFNEVIDFAQNGIEKDPEATWIYTNLAHGYMFTEQPVKAAKIYNKYLNIKLSDKFWNELILDDFSELKKNGVSHSFMDEISRAMHANLTWHLLFEQRFNDVISHGREALKYKSTSLAVRLNLAHAYLLLDQTELADSIYFAHLGEKFNNKFWEEAILQDFSDLENANITHADFKSLRVDMNGNLSWVLVLDKRYNEAIVAANKAIALNPNKKWLYTNLAHGYLMIGRYQSAKEIYLKYRGQYIFNNTKWEDAVLADFKLMEQKGIYSTHFYDIRMDLR